MKFVRTTRNWSIHVSISLFFHFLIHCCILSYPKPLQITCCFYDILISVYHVEPEFFDDWVSYVWVNNATLNKFYLVLSYPTFQRPPSLPCISQWTKSPAPSFPQTSGTFKAPWRMPLYWCPMLYEARHYGWMATTRQSIWATKGTGVWVRLLLGLKIRKGMELGGNHDMWWPPVDL